MAKFGPLQILFIGRNSAKICQFFQKRDPYYFLKTYLDTKLQLIWPSNSRGKNTFEKIKCTSCVWSRWVVLNLCKNLPTRRLFGLSLHSVWLQYSASILLLQFVYVLTFYQNREKGGPEFSTTHLDHTQENHLIV